MGSLELWRVGILPTNLIGWTNVSDGLPNHLPGLASPFQKLPMGSSPDGYVK